VGCLILIKRYLNLRTFKTLIHSFVYSIFDYCFIIWGNISATNIKLLQSRVNSLLGAFFYPQICNKYKKYNKISYSSEERPLNCPTIDYLKLHELCNLLTVSERLDYFRTLFVYKSLKFNRIPEISSNFLFGNSYRVQNLPIPPHKTKFYENSPFYQCILSWNQNSSNIKNLDNPKFLDNLNEWFIDHRMNEFVSS